MKIIMLRTGTIDGKRIWKKDSKHIVPNNIGYYLLCHKWAVADFSDELKKLCGNRKPMTLKQFSEYTEKLIEEHSNIPTKLNWK
jgi:hypothetical protein